MREVDRSLLEYFKPDEVFYDERYTALFGRPDAGKWLADVYKEAEVAVIFFSASHVASPWAQRELNAARERDYMNGEPVQLFHFGNVVTDSILGFGMEYWLSVERKYQGDAARVAAAIAEFYNQEVRPKDLPPVVRRRRMTRKRLWVEVGVGASVVAALGTAAVIMSGENDGNVWGVASLGSTFLAFVFLLFRIFLFLGKLERSVYYEPLSDEEPTGQPAGETTEQRLRRERNEWKEYSGKLEKYHQQRLELMGETLRSIRGGRIAMRAGLLMGMALASYHLILELVVREKAGDEGLPFLESAPWHLPDVYQEHHAHTCLIGGAFVLAFAHGLWFAGGDARSKTIAFTVGVSAPVLVGFAYIAFMVGGSYDLWFPQNGGGFTEELGNFFVLERLIFIPLACYLAAWMGCLGRRHLQRIPG